jgi:hypothetical protein
MYVENDVLDQALKEAPKDLGETAKGLPVEPPERGLLDIRQVRDAEYAFA